MTPNAAADTTRRNDLRFYQGWHRVSVSGNVLKFDGLPPLRVVVASPAELGRRAKLRELLGGRSRTELRAPYPDLWTMRDLTWALNLPHTPRWCGVIGKDLKALKTHRRHNVYGLRDARTGEPIPHCDVFSPARCDIMLDDIRHEYNVVQAKERFKVCQTMRERSKRLA